METDEDRNDDQLNQKFCLSEGEGLGDELENQSEDQRESQPNNKPTEEIKRSRRRDETLVTMLELLTGTRTKAEITEDVINEQKEAVEQMINEVQSNLNQIVHSSSENSLIEKKEELKTEPMLDALRLVHYDIIGQFDLTMGKVNEGVVNLFCQEKLQLVQLPLCFIPKGVNTGGVVSISIARKTTDEELRNNTILDIQKSLLECINSNAP